MPLLEKVKTFSFIILIISFCYSIFGTFPHNEGDPIDYLGLAKNLEFDLMRSPGYPIFLKIFSLNLRFLYIPTIIQICLFLLSILLVERELNKITKKSYFIFLISAFPNITYLQTLMFPDGIVLSFLLIYIYFLIREKYFYLFIVSIVLFSFKSYLIFVLFFSFLLFLEKKYYFLKKTNLKFYFTIFFPFIFYIFLPNYLVQPSLSKIDVTKIKFNYEFKCNSETIIINNNNLNLNTELFLQRTILKNFNNEICYNKINEQVSRKIISVIFINQYSEFFSNTIFNFISSLLGIGADHITTMISDNYMEKFKSITSDNIKYLNYSIIQNKLQGENYKKYLININTLSEKFNLLHIHFFNEIQKLISIIIFLLVIYCLIKNYKKKDVSNIFAMNLNFAIIHSIFPIIIVDRHILYMLILNLIIILVSKKIS